MESIFTNLSFKEGVKGKIILGNDKDIKMDPNTYYWHFSKPDKYMLIQKVPEDVTSDWLKLAYECKALLRRDGIDVSEIKLPKFRR